MGAAVDLRPTEASSSVQRALEELQVARDALVKDRTAALNRQKQVRHRLLKQQHKHRLAQLDRHLATIDTEIGKRLAEDEGLARRTEILTSIPGVGVVAQIKCEVERDPDETGGMKSRVHPKYKTKYRVRNWASYERALIGRGNMTIWLSRAASAAWKPEGTRTRGAPPKYSDLAIETALTLRLLFHLPLRQAEGFLTSLFHLMGLDLRSPDHTTLSRRGQHLNLTLRRVPRRAALHLFIDSTGRSMVGEGEWAAAKHGRRGRRGGKKALSS